MLPFFRQIIICVLLCQSSIGYGQFTCDIFSPFINQVPNLSGESISDSDFPIYVADNFTFTQTTIVNHVCWFGIYGPNNTPTGNDDFTVTYFQNNAGMGIPGTQIISFTPTTLYKKEATGNNLGSFAEYGYSLFHTDVIFNPGTYWISIVNNTVDDTDDDWAWEHSDIGDGDRASSSDGINWIPNSMGIDYAFILGYSAPNVPTLSQWGVIILGMSLIIFGSLAIRQKIKSTA